MESESTTKDSSSFRNGMDKPTSADNPYILSNPKELFRGQWLGARQMDFRHKRTNHSGVWQMAFRTSTPKDTRVDGVSVIPILKQMDKKFIILVKQYRIPLMNFTLEFPAGLVDAGESVCDSAMRELKVILLYMCCMRNVFKELKKNSEETGYTATRVLKITSGKQPLDSGLTDDSVNLVLTEIDGQSPENQNVKQFLTEGEDIEVILIPIQEFMVKIDQFTDSGIDVDYMVYSFALGLSLGSGTVVHPKAKLIAESGPIIIGENNLIEENATIINRHKPKEDGSPVSVYIGNDNVFEVGSRSEALRIGSNNIIEAYGSIGPEVQLSDGCIIGAMCDIRTRKFFLTKQ